MKDYIGSFVFCHDARTSCWLLLLINRLLCVFLACHLLSQMVEYWYCNHIPSKLFIITCIVFWIQNSSCESERFVGRLQHEIGWLIWRCWVFELTTLISTMISNLSWVFLLAEILNLCLLLFQKQICSDSGQCKSLRLFLSNSYYSFHSGLYSYGMDGGAIIYI